jgi:probable rRNA maturation factor
VLSFAQRDEFPGEPGIPDIPELADNLGDVVISLDTALRQANARGVSLDEEVRLLLVHGTLHLLGYEDDTDDGADEMREREIALGVRQPDDLPSASMTTA